MDQRGLEDIRSESEVCRYGLTELGALYRSRALSPIDVTLAVLRRIERLNPLLNAFITVLRESALRSATVADVQFRNGIDTSPLQGVPVSVKDLFQMEGSTTTAGSRVLENGPTDLKDADVVRSLRLGGAVLIGKTNLYEFGVGSPGAEGPFGEVQNPRKLGFQAGSSSSGSAAAVATGMGVASIVSDTGGSARHPASVCGVVGLKPTFGRISTRGLLPLSRSLDNVGIIARTVNDVAGMFESMHPDRGSRKEVGKPKVSSLARIDALRVGLPTNSSCREGVGQAVALLWDSFEALGHMGMQLAEFELPYLDEANGIYSAIMVSDAANSQRRYAASAYLYGKDLLERLRLADAVTKQDYLNAHRARRDLRRKWLSLFDQVDLIAIPSNLGPPPRLREKTVTTNQGTWPSQWVTSRFNRIANLSGLPALAVPIGDIDGGFPIAMQLLAPDGREDLLFACGRALENRLGVYALRAGIEPRW